jgi:ADP-ribose pyrophosphatase YjhB (NUDIX family)
MCGSKYADLVRSGFHLKCDECGYVYHENLRVAAGSVIVKGNKVLLAKRAVDPAKDRWDLPGGFSEPNEHPRDTAVREAKEELGVECEVIELFGIYAPNPYMYMGKTNFVCDVFYLMMPKSLDFKPLDDVSEVKWFAIDSMPEDKELAFPTTRKALKELRNRKGA